MCGSKRLDSPPFGKILMKLGLALIVVGHLNFIVGAIVHGLVLRHVSELKDTVSVHYSMANISAVASAILSISCGIIAIVLSRYLEHKSLRWALVVLTIVNAMLSAACTVGTAVSVIITIANRGRTLLSSCRATSLELIQISHECPFDPTRIYSTSLCLWVISLILDATELVFSTRCFITVLQLMKVRICRKRAKRRVKLQIPHIEEDASAEQEELNTDEGYSVWL